MGYPESFDSKLVTKALGVDLSVVKKRAKNEHWPYTGECKIFCVSFL